MEIHVCVHRSWNYICKTGLCSGKGKGELYCLQRPVVEYGYMCEAQIVNKAIARLIIL